MVSEEEFLLWKEHPITRWVLTAANRAAALQREAWIAKSWEQGEASPLALSELRTRADAYSALDETTYEGWRAMHDEHPAHPAA
jgi:hypothetical protein